MFEINTVRVTNCWLLKKLKARELSEDTLMEIQALGFRAIQTA